VSEPPHGMEYTTDSGLYLAVEPGDAEGQPGFPTALRQRPWRRTVAGPESTFGYTATLWPTGSRTWGWTRRAPRGIICAGGIQPPGNHSGKGEREAQPPSAVLATAQQAHPVQRDNQRRPHVGKDGHPQRSRAHQGQCQKHRLDAQ
jgi:hypothetical protein